MAETKYLIAPNLWPRSFPLRCLMTRINTCVLAVITLNCNLQNTKEKSTNVSLVWDVCCDYAFAVISSSQVWSHSPALSFQLQTSGRCLEDSGSESGLSSPPTDSANTFMNISWLLNIQKNSINTWALQYKCSLSLANCSRLNYWYIFKRKYKNTYCHKNHKKTLLIGQISCHMSDIISDTYYAVSQHACQTANLSQGHYGST